MESSHYVWFGFSIIKRAWLDRSLMLDFVVPRTLVTGLSTHLKIRSPKSGHTENSGILLCRETCAKFLCRVCWSAILLSTRFWRALVSGFLSANCPFFIAPLFFKKLSSNQKVTENQLSLRLATQTKILPLSPLLQAKSAHPQRVLGTDY